MGIYEYPTFMYAYMYIYIYVYTYMYMRAYPLNHEPTSLGYAREIKIVSVSRLEGSFDVYRSFL